MSVDVQNAGPHHKWHTQSHERRRFKFGRRTINGIHTQIKESTVVQSLFHKLLDLVAKLVANTKMGVQSDEYSMKTSPRRKDRAINDAREMGAFLDRMAVGRLGMSTEDGPYVVPVNYIFAEGCIYFHSAPKGKKVDALRSDPRVCFVVDEPGPQVLWEKGCGITQVYESVMCFGKTEFIEKIAEKRRILEMLVEKYVPGDKVSILNRSRDMIANIAIVKIDIEWMTGKANRISSVHQKISNQFLSA